MEYFAHSQREFVYKYIVMLSDIDKFEHMSFANYLKLMFLAADALLSELYKPNFLNKFRLRLEHSRMQFKKQTVSGDKILIKVNSSGISHQSFSLLFTFVIEGSGELVGLGRQTYKAILRSNEEAFDIPSILISLLESVQVVEENLLYKY